MKFLFAPLDHVFLEHLFMNLSSLTLEALLDFFSELFHQLRATAIVLVDSAQGVIVVNVVGRVFYAKVLQQGEQTLLGQLLIVEVEVAIRLEGTI
jgi:hypothetical protein